MSADNSDMADGEKNFAEGGDLSISRDSLSTISEGSGDLEAAVEELNGETLEAMEDPSLEVLSLSSQDSLTEERKPSAKKPPIQRSATVTGAMKPKTGKPNGTAKTGIPMKRPPLNKSKSGSDASIVSTASEKGSPAIKETRASMARKQKLLHAQNAEPEPDYDYLTPLQKKDQMMKDLKKELRDTQTKLQQRESELNDIVSMKDSEISFLMNEKETEIQELGDSVKQVEREKKDLQKRYKEAMSMLSECESTIKEMEAERTKREAMHQEMYFTMYLKGQKSAQFERQDEIAKVAEENPTEVSVTELLEKLNTTQEELTKWQSLKREELYSKAEKPETEADCVLRFLRDSMFHYLTVKEDKDQAQHLRAMVGILGFTEVQLKKIAKAKEENKKK